MAAFPMRCRPPYRSFPMGNKMLLDNEVIICFHLEEKQQVSLQAVQGIEKPRKEQGVVPADRMGAADGLPRQEGDGVGADQLGKTAAAAALLASPIPAYEKPACAAPCAGTPKIEER